MYDSSMYGSTSSVLSTAVDSDSDSGDVLSTGIASAYGILMVKETTTGISAYYKLIGTNHRLSDGDLEFSATKDTASAINIYYESGAFQIQNLLDNDLFITAALLEF